MRVVAERGVGGGHARQHALSVQAGGGVDAAGFEERRHDVHQRDRQGVISPPLDQPVRIPPGPGRMDDEGNAGRPAEEVALGEASVVEQVGLSPCPYPDNPCRAVMVVCKASPARVGDDHPARR